MSGPVDVLAVLDADAITVDWHKGSERGKQSREARAAVAELIADHKALYKHYVNTLESGRDRIIALGGDCDPVDIMERGDPVLARSRELIARIGGAA